MDRKKIAEAIDEAAYYRIQELEDNPALVAGNFDLKHLLEIHRHIFQDAPNIDAEYSKAEIMPGQLRPEVERWSKKRQLEVSAVSYYVDYRVRNFVGEIESALNNFGDLDVLKGLSKWEFSEAMAKLYADLDTVHPFREGNSRTLRTFTRLLARELALSWTGKLQMSLQHSVMPSILRETRR